MALAFAVIVAPPARAGGVSNEARLFTSSSAPDANVLRLALDAASCARSANAVVKSTLLTLIDYSRPSTEPRLWVVDLADGRILYQELVAHGRGSGDNYATRFSNQPGSLQSSLGLFRTGGTYVGRNGYSLRLEGLEPGVNDRAIERAIVIHGAPYVRTGMDRALGRLGRSWGCPAVRSSVARTLIDTIKDGSLVFAYYPDRRWLQGSRFIGACTGVGRTAGTAEKTTPAAHRVGERYLMRSTSLPRSL
jgi:hypothetical protein